jgi:intracellular multiplication protein IcmS
MAEDNIVKTMSVIMKEMGVGFTLNGSPTNYGEVFSPTGMLPAIARRADQLCSLCLGYGIGVTFEDEKSTLLGTKVKFDDVTPDILRYLCMTDVLCELMKASTSKESVALDELMYD